MSAAAARGVVVLLGYCDEDTRQNPYGPFVEALSTALRAADLPSREEFLREFPPPISALFTERTTQGLEASPPDRSVLAAGLRQVLERLAAPDEQFS